MSDPRSFKKLVLEPPLEPRSSDYVQSFPVGQTWRNLADKFSK